MNKYFLLILLAGSLSLVGQEGQNLADQNLSDRLSDAIEASNWRLARRLVRRMGPLDPHVKQHFVESAKGLVSDRKEDCTLSRSPWDAAKLFAGAGVAAASIYLGYRTFKNYQDEPSVSSTERNKYSAKGGGCVLGFLSGCYLMLKGYYCDIAYARVNLAHKVADVVKKAVEKESTSEDQSGQQEPPKDEEKSAA